MVGLSVMTVPSPRLGPPLSSFCVRCFGQPLDRREASIPLPGEISHGSTRLVEAVGFYLEEDLSTLFASTDQPGVFEYDEMLGNRLAGEGNVASQRPCTGLTVADEEVEDSATRRVGDSRPQLVINLHRHLDGFVRTPTKRSSNSAHPP